MGEKKIMNKSSFSIMILPGPFAVIGIFLVILSTIVSLNLTRMDIKMAKTMSPAKYLRPTRLYPTRRQTLRGRLTMQPWKPSKTWRNTCYQT